jgi:hypothetical protein
MENKYAHIYKKNPTLKIFLISNITNILNMFNIFDMSDIHNIDLQN